MAESTCPRCGASKPSYNFACSPCWFALPGDVRREINRAYRKHGAMSDEWVKAASAAFKAWGMEEPPWLVALKQTHESR